MYQAAIIHLSDPEFGPKNRAEREEIKELIHEPYKMILKDFVSDVRTEVIEKHEISPENIGLVISGDIVDKGELTKDYQKAIRQIRMLRDEIGIPNDQIAIVPGNHDVSWSECRKAYEAKHKDHPQYDEKEIRDQVRRSEMKLANFADFFQDICFKKFKVQNPITFEAFEKLGVVLIGLDTTYPSLWSDDDNFGAIQAEQVQIARENLKNCITKNEGLIAIAVMHHSLLPDRDNGDSSYLHYAPSVRRWLEKNNGFDIVLCGHEHTSKRCRSIGSDFNILVTGSFGLCLNELNDRYKEGQIPVTNKYQVILISTGKQLKFLYRRLNREDATFPTGKWEADISEGYSFSEITLQDRQEIANVQQEFGIDILEIGKPVKSLTMDGKKCWKVGVKTNGGALFPKQIKRVNYKIEPSGDEFEGDPDNGFVAVFEIFDLQARTISAGIKLTNGDDIPIENVAIPPAYDPSDYILCAEYLQ